MTSRKTRASAIPVGTQFTPQLVHLPLFVQALLTGSGTKSDIEKAVWEPAVRIRPRPRPTSRRTASLPVEAAVQYGLLTPEYEATQLTRDLAALPEPAIYDEFAKHILLRCGGLRVLEAIDQMSLEKLSITGDSLASYLTAQGFNVTVHNTAINSLRMWLAKAGLFGSEGRGHGAWSITPGSREKLLGLSSDSISVLSGLAPHQLAFIDALCAASPKKEYLASEIRSLAIARNPDVAFDRGSLPNDVLQPLADAGLITFKAGGTASGKSSTLSVTESFNRNVLEVFVRETVKDLDVAIASYYRKRPADIYAELRSTNKAVKGRALEALAIRLMRLLGLRFIAWNNRAKDTGYAEVDAVLAGVFGAVPTRWQIQCKNTPGSSRVDLEDIAKEVGLTPITRATHVLFLANNGFTSEARKFAAEIMQNTALTIFLLGSREFGMLEKDDTVLGGLLRQQAEEIVRAVRRNSVFDWK